MLKNIFLSCFLAAIVSCTTNPETDSTVTLVLTESNNGDTISVHIHDVAGHRNGQGI